MKKFPLNKSNKLCSLIAIEALFSRQNDCESAFAFPLRVVWRVNPSRKADINIPKFFISVPKRRLRHAVDRVTMRRRIREAYRLNRLDCFEGLNGPVDIAIIYVADKMVDYRMVEKSMLRVLKLISESCSDKLSAKS